MGIIILFITSLMWSFVGILVKAASTMVDSATITFSRFFFGIIFLGIFILMRDKKIIVYWKSKWIWIGVIGKCCNYVFENLGISMGYAYGNILVMPFQAVFLLMVSAFYFKEKITIKSWSAAILCLIGVFLVSWNGIPLTSIFQTSFITTILFVISAVGAGFHFLSQKVLISTMDSGNMNFSVFLWSTLITAAPLPSALQLKGPIHWLPFLSLAALGFITGISFYLYANALKKVPFLAAVILGNSSAIFTLVWAWLFFHESITPYIMSGVLFFLAGVILLNLPTQYGSSKKPHASSEASESIPDEM